MLACDCESLYVRSDSWRRERAHVTAEQECLCPITNHNKRMFNKEVLPPRQCLVQG